MLTRSQEHFACLLAPVWFVAFVASHLTVAGSAVAAVTREATDPLWMPDYVSIPMLVISTLLLVFTNARWDEDTFSGRSAQMAWYLTVAMTVFGVPFLLGVGFMFFFGETDWRHYLAFVTLAVVLLSPWRTRHRQGDEVGDRVFIPHE